VVPENNKLFILGRFQQPMPQQRKTQTIPLAPVVRILNRAGAKRVSQEAAQEFADVLTNITEEIANKAVQVSKHSGRKTVHDSDVRIAAKTV
jgi:DNA-binding protein